MDNPIPPPAQPNCTIPEMTSDIQTIPDDPTTVTASSLFDWSDFIDFGFDDPLAALSFDSDLQQQEAPPASEPVVAPLVEDTGRARRKRDPRLVCSNFLAGRVPCACPELDEELELELEQDEQMAIGGPGKKRVRTVRLPAGSPARCQVPGCEADISELKGYHRRHRVCLQCANASDVVLDGQNKRYCQQCGKFHILSDFDEGKRSCRRKLERHNNRRRRKSVGGKGIEKEPQQAALSEDVSWDDETGKDNICSNTQMAEGETFVDSEGQLSTLTNSEGQLSTLSNSEGQLSTRSSAHNCQNNQIDSNVSFAAFVTQAEGEKETLKHKHSPSYCDNKSAFSSMCPTGRISFKLYDWNPAEFPRRLRHQIFQWLASMPVELEGYIRPGCTILTIFVAMPKSMWTQLFDEPVLHLRDFVKSPGNMLLGRGTFFAFLNDVVFSVIRDGASVMKVKVKEHTPKLHYVHPTCFEAGKPMEFVACGSNLLQARLRFLVSFAGKYLAYNLSVLSSCCIAEGKAGGLNHQVLKISVPHTDPNVFGPAFIEVENESGLSNFIPVVIADEDICAELRMMQQIFDSPLSKTPEFVAHSYSCRISTSRQQELSEFIADMAWLLKRPGQEILPPITIIQIGRINNLFSFLIRNYSTAILDRLVHYVTTMIDIKLNSEIAGADMDLLRRNMDDARDMLCQRLKVKGHLGKIPLHQSYQNDILSIVPFTNQGVEVMQKPVLESRASLISPKSTATIPLLKGDVVMSVNFTERVAKPCSPLLTNKLLTSRPLILAITTAAVCFGVCVALLHPQKVGILATTIRRCLLEKS